MNARASSPFLAGTGNIAPFTDGVPGKFTNLDGPRGLALDEVNKRLYVVTGGAVRALW